MCQIPVVARVGDTQLAIGKTRAPHQMLGQVASHLTRPVVPVWLTMPRSGVATADWVEAIARALGSVATLETPQSGTIYLVTIDGFMPDQAAIGKVAAKAAREIARQNVERQRRLSAEARERRSTERRGQRATNHTSATWPRRKASNDRHVTSGARLVRPFGAWGRFFTRRAA